MRCCWTGGRPWAGLPWVQQTGREESAVSYSTGWGSVDCGASGCGTTEVISVPLGGVTDCCSDVEAPVCLAPPGLSVLPPPPRASWAAGSGGRPAEPPRPDAPAVPAKPVPQPQLRAGRKPYRTGVWNENGPREVRRTLSFSEDLDLNVDYVPRGTSLWEERLEADWATEDSEDRWGSPNENAPYFLGEP